MSYMDQGMDCIRGCGREHSQFSTGVCLTCEAKEREEKRKAEWDAKTPLEQALHHLESWANPQNMTFDKSTAKFVLGIVKSIAAPSVSSAANGDELPPLPVIPAGYSRKSDYDPQGGSPLFSVDQMRAHARAAVLAEREAIARQIEGDVGIGALGAAIQVAIAATIRARN